MLGSRTLAVASYGIARIFQKVATFATLGLVSSFTHGFKHKTKQAIAQHGSGIDDSKRISALKKLSEINDAAYDKSKDVSRPELFTSSGLEDVAAGILKETIFKKHQGKLKHSYKKNQKPEAIEHLEKTANSTGASCACHTTNRRDLLECIDTLKGGQTLMNMAADHALLFDVRKKTKNDMFVWSSLSDAYAETAQISR